MPEETNLQKSEVPTADVERHHFTSTHTPHPPAPGRKLPVKLIVLPIVITAALAACVYFFGPKPAQHNFDRHARPRTVPVTVAKAEVKSVPIEIRTTGNVQPYSVVNVVPQVGGQLMKVYFTQGQNVKKGDLLFQIDPRPYQASYAQAQGNVAKDSAQVRAAKADMLRDQANIGQLQANLDKDQASLRYAQVEYDRYKRLVQQGAISMEQADQTLTSAATAQAQIQADKKQIENAQAVVSADQAQIETMKGTLEADEAAASNARIQLDWCTIRAPIDGRTGSLNVYQGNVVAANSQTALVSIAQLQPIYISFTIPEDYLDQVRRALGNNTLQIQAMIEGVKTNLVIGNASFLENTVNTTSGTALLRAELPNTDGRLYPGQFVDVVVTMPADGPTTVVPSAAIQTTQKGNAVYVVHPDNTVDMVPVDLKRAFDDSAAITGNVKAGDLVVTDGQLQLVPGASVRIVTPDGMSAGSPDDSGAAQGGNGNSLGGGHRRHGGWGHHGANGQQGGGAFQGNGQTGGN